MTKNSSLVAKMMLCMSCLVKGNLKSWLQDENCFDQCAVVYNQGLQVAIAQSTQQEIKIVTEREVGKAVVECMWCTVRGCDDIHITLEIWEMICLCAESMFQPCLSLLVDLSHLSCSVLVLVFRILCPHIVLHSLCIHFLSSCLLSPQTSPHPHLSSSCSPSLCVALDWDVYSLVSSRLLLGNAAQTRCGSLGDVRFLSYWQVWASGSATHWFLSLWKVSLMMLII